MSQESIVEYIAAHEAYTCGYCKNDATSFSHGLWAHALSPQDYQDLINRGWRRSGKYCYKPNMKVTCCPQYTIRCDATKFKLSRSQKKVLKRMHKFLENGQKEKVSPGDGNTREARDQPMEFECPTNLDLSSTEVVHDDVAKCNKEGVEDADAQSLSDDLLQCSNISQQPDCEADASAMITKDSPKSDVKPCRKAKDIRRERRIQKLVKSGLTLEEASKTTKPQKCKEKSLEDFLNEPFSKEPVHKLELRLVPSNSTDQTFSESFVPSYNIYQKYQMIIHKDPPEKCSEKQFLRFLVNNPYQCRRPTSTIENKYGSFHQQYWLDDKLIAVGVIDILSKCVSSVYLFYDPDYSFLSLGTYASLREIAFTREMHRTIPNLIYYYMGYYIHSCPKMKYKAAYAPSFLLCPETYIFHSVEKSLPKLEISKYSRLEENSKVDDTNGQVNVDEVLILYQRRAMSYNNYRIMNQDADDEDFVAEYAGFVGRKSAKSMFLYRG